MGCLKYERMSSWGFPGSCSARHLDISAENIDLPENIAFGAQNRQRKFEENHELLGVEKLRKIAVGA